LRQINDQLPAADILVIDDDSPDGTAREVESRIQGNRRITLIKREERGLGGAYRHGLQFGLDHGYEALVTMDADFSHDPKYLPALLAALQENELVVGCRYIKDGGTINWRLRRILLSWLANSFARFMLQLRGHDFTSGYRAYRRSILERINLNSIFSNGYSYLVEMYFLAQKNNARIKEVPIIFFDRKMGISKISRREIYRGFFTIIRLRFFWKRRR
jgi:dolichol-phosphate mannosyltransferase